MFTLYWCGPGSINFDIGLPQTHSTLSQIYYMKPALPIRKKYVILFLIMVIIAALIFIGRRKENYKERRDVGFIITRHVNSKETNKVWKICISQIRQNYPDAKIIIIDDNSNYAFVDTSDVDLHNCEIVNSEFKKRGELLPYYYFYKNKWFDQAVFIHDSVFINNTIDVEHVDDVRFLWHFNGGEHENEANIERLLSVLNYKDDLIRLFRDKSRWKGCWGVMSVVSHSFLQRIMEKYGIERLLEHVQNREDRMAMERVFGVVCMYEKPEMFANPSIFGYYEDHKNNRNSNDYSYDQYVEDVQNGNMRASINKLFFGR